MQRVELSENGKWDTGGERGDGTLRYSDSTRHGSGYVGVWYLLEAELS